MRQHSHESSTEFVSGLVCVGWKLRSGGMMILKAFPADSELQAMRQHSHESSTEFVSGLVAVSAGNVVEEA